MIEQGPSQTQRIELLPGDSKVKGMLTVVTQLKMRPSVTIVGSLGDVAFTRADATEWLQGLLSRGGAAKTFTPVIGKDIYRAFSQAQQKDPCLALATAEINIPPTASAVETLISAIDAVVYKTGSKYAEGNAVTVRVDGGRTFYIRDLEIAEKWDQICNG